MSTRPPKASIRRQLVGAMFGSTTAVNGMPTRCAIIASAMARLPDELSTRWLSAVTRPAASACETM